MSRNDRERAQRISEYVDGLVVHRREERPRPFSAEDREFGELASLSRVLSEIELRAPEDFGDNLRERLPALAANRPLVGGGWVAGARQFSRRLISPAAPSPRWFPRLTRALPTAAAMALLVALAVAFLWQFASTPTASAAEILSRADMALARLVRPGEVLYRRWKVTDRVTAPAGGPDILREWLSHEWMDGSDFARVAARNETLNGRVRLAYVSVREDGELRPRVYFPPGFSSEPHGLLSIEPSRREFQEAVAAFPPGAREKLQTYLDRGYIFEPISGERRFNRLALETSVERNSPLPRIMVSLRQETLPSGVLVHAVRIVDPARVRFRWRSEGPPVVWLERRETVRYIARDTYLSLKAEETYGTEDGRRVFTTRELLETRIGEPGADGIDPFVLTVPEGTPVRRQSATEQLSAVARLLRQIPPSLSSSSWSASPAGSVWAAAARPPLQTEGARAQPGGDR